MKPPDLPPLFKSATPSVPSCPILDRRSFIAHAAATAAAAASGLATAGLLRPDTICAEELGPKTWSQRANRAYAIRHKAALLQKRTPHAHHVTNGDEERYSNRAGNYSKGLPHDAFGEVDLNAYDALLRALRSGEGEDFDAVPMGAVSQDFQRKFVNPQAAFAFDLEGPDSHALAIRPPPALSSLEAAGEILENYWMALLRDVPFSEYATNPLAQAAMVDLSAASDFRGPKLNGQVTAQTLFRDELPGTTVGPYISQFLWLPVPFGANYIEQKMRTVTPGIDFLTTFPLWLSAQRGERPTQALQYESTRRYIRNGRDLAQWVHVDMLFQAYFHALLIMLAAPDLTDQYSNGMGVPFDSANPYSASLNQEGFGTFGAPHIASLMCEVANRAVKAAWFQKWAVHRRLRPEAFAGRVHNQLRGVREYPLAMDELLRTRVLTELSSRHHGYLLPVAFPEGSPLHPSYAAGHATVAGACVTVLKAWFPESYVIENPVVVAPDGLSLLPYSGPALTVGGELNKLASNIATGRNIAGAHWRSDAAESLKLGETIAIGILRDQSLTYNERFDGFALRKFDGSEVIV